MTTQENVTDKYILVNGEPIPEPDLLKWARWFETSGDERIVAKTQLPDCTVSTIFLGLDHGMMRPAGAHILWETMVFGGPHDGEMRRYATRYEALAGHEEIVADLRAPS